MNDTEFNEISGGGTEGKMHYCSKRKGQSTAGHLLLGSLSNSQRCSWVLGQLQKGDHICAKSQKKGELCLLTTLFAGTCVYICLLVSFFLLFLLKTNKIPSLFTTSKGGGKGGKRIIINGENRYLQRKNASHILMSKIKLPKSCSLF